MLMKKSSIVLIGFMGVGKTAVGKCLADYLQVEFIDTDLVVETEAGMTIPEIFQRYGEKRFRALECKVVREAAACSRKVIATGGGVVLNPENLRLLREKGCIILLEAQPEVIEDRLKKQGGRPLLYHGKDLRSRIQELLDERQKYYQDCDFAVDTSDLSVEQVAKEITSLLKYQVREPEEGGDFGNPAG